MVQDLELRNYGYRERLVDPAYFAPLPTMARRSPSGVIR